MLSVKKLSFSVQKMDKKILPHHCNLCKKPFDGEEKEF